MKIRRYWWIGTTAAVAVILGAWLAVPALASPARQSDEPAPDAYAAMHEACEAGDVQGMTEVMDSLSDEDWGAMEEHMNDEGHRETMGSGMMGMGGMMGTGTMGGVTGGQSGQGMMGW